MIHFENQIKKNVSNIFPQIPPSEIPVVQTKKDINADLAIILFPLAKKLRTSPQQIAEKITPQLKHLNFISNIELVKGFLNITIDHSAWTDFIKNFDLNTLIQQIKQPSPQKILIEFSSPNTNKPQHLGHIRNNLLGDSISKILQTIGHNVIKINLINDRGIHICKSMLAWKKWGNGITPEKAGKKGDHLVGDFYVMFENEYKKQVNELIQKGIPKEQALKQAPIILEAQDMLRKWEQGDPEVLKIWETMNSWVIKGFEQTYNELGIHFDKIYFESQTYKLGKKIILEKLKQNIVQKAPDGSVFIDLSDVKLDKKILLRSDGTSVYITQDIGNAVLRYNEFNFDLHYYVVADEQIYHFKVLKEILKRFGYNWYNRIIHFSYGMVELPEGKMKSREGKVVDADDLINEMYQTAQQKSQELGKLHDLPEHDKNNIIKQIGMAALKFYILNVDPQRTVLFIPQKSIDFQGKTGPFIQYSYARIQSLLRKANEKNITVSSPSVPKLNDKEITLVKYIYFYPQTILSAAKELNPAIISNYIYNLAKDFNSFYHDYPILSSDDPQRSFRLLLADAVGQILKHGLSLLGIQAPPKM